MLPLGDYYPMDAEGRVLNRTASEQIPFKWKQAIPWLVAEYENRLGEALHSVWLRGSVAAGTPVDGVSDLDSFALVKGSPQLAESGWRPVEWETEASDQLVHQYPFIEKVEFVTLSWPVEDQKTLRHLVPMMQTQGLCLQGDNPVAGWPAPRLADLKRNGRWIATDWRALNDNIWDMDVVRAFVKTFIRGAFEEVMEREGKYATDFYPCIQSILKYRPDWEASMVEMVDIFCRPKGKGRRLHDIAVKMVTEVLEKTAF